MNNRGQVLVVFLLILPIVFTLFALIIDNGVNNRLKVRIDNNVKAVIEYGLDHINDDHLQENMENLMKENIDNIDFLKITIDNETIEVIVEKNSKSIFANVLGKERYQIKTFYVGYIENKTKVIKKG